MKKKVSVLIAGGGPAGMATALSLANRGLNCLVIDAGNPSGNKTGGTIPPNALPMLIRSGIDHLLADPVHLPCYGNSYIWGSDAVSRKGFFGQAYQHGWHISRMY